MSIESHQCPYCELRFAAKWELDLHITESHPGRAESEDAAEDD